MKIYIIPPGWDRELVIKSVFKSGADRVCLLSAVQKQSHTYSASDAITRNVNAYIVKEISKFTDVDVLELNYIDMKDIFVKVDQYIKAHKDADFTINISTGSRLLSSTLVLIAFMNNIDIEYSVAKNHNPKIMKLIEGGEDYHCGFTEVLRFPSVPISLKFSAKEKSFLKRIKGAGSLSVAEFIDGTRGDMENRLRSEFHYLSKKLEKQGILEIKNKGKKVDVQLTSFGELCVAD